MRNLLSGRDDLQGMREGLWIGRLEARVSQLRLSGKATLDELLG